MTDRDARSAARGCAAVVAVATVALLAPAPVHAAPAPLGAQRQDVIVETMSLAGAAAIVTEERLHGTAVHAFYRRAMHGFAATMNSDRVAALRRNPQVKRIEADHEIHAVGSQTNPPWGLDRIDQQRQPLDGTYNYDTTGAGVVAIVVDSGIRPTHAEFAGRVLPGYDVVDRDPDPTDCDGHGTHVAGTIGGSTYGVAKQVQLLPVRALDCSGSGRVSDGIAALDWILANRPAGPAVVNFSVGGPPDPLVDQAIGRVVDAGLPVVVAAGNGNADACGGSPGRLAAAITVAATNRNDARASFSDWGDCIDLFAPGVGVTSAWMTSDTATATASGTSMAAPHVTGAVARFLQAQPQSSPAQVAGWLHARSTLGIVTDAFAQHNDLLYTGPDPQAPAPPATVGTAPTISGNVTPSTVVLDGTGPKAYTVSVTSNVPLESRLSGYLRNGSAAEFLLFDNPTMDKVNWTATGQMFDAHARGIWTLGEVSSMWFGPVGQSITGALAIPSPITVALTDHIGQTDQSVPTVVPLPATKVAKIRISFVRWDAKGADSNSNVSLNGEFVRLRNVSQETVALTGYTLRDHQGHVYRFPQTRLAPGRIITVHTGRGRNTATTRYWGRLRAVWGNTKDVAQLRDRQAQLVSNVRWNRHGSGYSSF